MRTPASIKHHPIHPMLIALPIGLWVFSFVCDIAARVNIGAIDWSKTAWVTMVGGTVGALLAAIPGLIDFISIKDPRTKRIGWVHMALNLAAVAVYAANVCVRDGGQRQGALPFGLSLLGLALIAVSGWYGAEMIYEHNVGVREDHAPL
jgi:uncharacterized membrane protein